MVLHATDDPAADPERVRILESAERLFYAHGLQQVGMDQVRGGAGVSLKRLYREFPSKDQLIEAYLVRRDARWLGALRAAVAQRPTAPVPTTPVPTTGPTTAPTALTGPAIAPTAAERRTSRARILAAFDWLGAWFAEPGFRGCAFTNSFGELGADSGTVAAVAAAHKAEFRAVFVGLVAELAGEHPTRTVDPGLGEQLYLLAEGAITAAAISGDAATARSARTAAATLLAAAVGPAVGPTTEPGRQPVRAEPGRGAVVKLFRRVRRRR